MCRLYNNIPLTLLNSIHPPAAIIRLDSPTYNITIYVKSAKNKSSKSEIFFYPDLHYLVYDRKIMAPIYHRRKL